MRGVFNINHWACVHYRRSFRKLGDDWYAKRSCPWRVPRSRPRWAGARLES